MAVATEMAAATPLLKTCFTFRSIGIDSKIHCSNFKLRYRAAPIRASSSTAAPADSKRIKIRRPQNVDGDFFVDDTCINCDVCRWMAPETFRRSDGKSAVFQQPTCGERRTKALQALLSCPTNSIHTEQPPPEILDVQMTFPIPIDYQNTQGVYHCGYHSKKSYGAASYFITRPEGNILIDSPRYTKRLSSIIKKMGGARYMFLTHRDDVADHEKWSEELGCPRILHSEEVNSSTANVEIKLEGTGPWTIGSDVILISTPGHTEGSVSLLYKTKKVLFTGDHFMMNEFGFTISEAYNWFSVPIQLNSVKKLLEFEFEWILPGHGRRARFKDVEDKNSALKAFLASKGVQT
ncbi:uncharacterized protein [Henckelia pumila]|uniref:uncharacterized protein isoform X1 n=1 Tax=Henckelia pumila TaxID=405737 RepID=UPI003C6DEA5D